MRTINIHAAETHLSRLVEEAAKGEAFVIAKAGRPLVKVVPLDAPSDQPRPRLEMLTGALTVPDDFDRMGDDEIGHLLESARRRGSSTRIPCCGRSRRPADGRPLSGTQSRPGKEIVFNATSLGEVATESGIGGPDFTVDRRLLRRVMLDAGYLEPVVTSAHAVAAHALPALQIGPFDRLLVAQAQVEGITLPTADEAVAACPGPIRQVREAGRTAETGNKKPRRGGVSRIWPKRLAGQATLSV